jgi:hypothetical protein
MGLKSALIGAIVALAASASSPSGSTDTDQKYTKEKFKSDVKSAAKGVKNAGMDVARQVGTGTKKAYRSAKAKVKKDVKDGRPGDGSIARKNEAAATAADGHK